MMTKQEHDASVDLIAKQTMIADQREANQQMVSVAIRAQESEERYRTLFDLCPVAVYSCDSSGVIQKFNRHAAELWGREPVLGDADERFCGSLKMFLPDGRFMPHEQCPMAEVLNGKLSEVRNAEVLIERPDGTRVTVVVNIRPLKNQRGEITSAINCFHDITERKQAENQLGDSLTKEREMAEFRELFIGILGHDLRNPLSSVVTSAALLLRRDRLNAQDAETVARIIRSSQRMTQMITQLLGLTQARLGGGLPIEPRPTDLREVCRNVVEEFETIIELEVEGDLSGTWDTDRLAEALSNLAGNALEYAAPGTAVRVEAHGDGAEVIVEISNQGEPIPAEVLPFIFEPFRRAQPREKSATGHLGLGLYIAREIVLSHGGTLEARSLGGTTTFAMRLPRCPPVG